MTNVIAFRAPLRVIEQSPAGTHGYPPPAPDGPRVDVTACLDGYRVYLDGQPCRDFVTLSNAARFASALSAGATP